MPTEVDRPDQVLRMMWQPRLRRGVWADTERGVAAMASITPPPSPWLAESETAGLLEGVRRWAESRPAGAERERVLACVARLRTPSSAAGRGYWGVTAFTTETMGYLHNALAGALAAAVGAIVLLRGRDAWRGRTRRRRLKDGLCPGCEYPMPPEGGRCSECGGLTRGAGE